MSDDRPCTRAYSPTTAPQIDLERINATLRTAYHCFCLLSSQDGPSSLQELLLLRLPHIPRESWEERFAFGGVYVNGREALSDQALPRPCRVEYYEPKFAISDAATIFPSFEERFIVFQDSAIAVVYKPDRLPSMPAKEQRHFSLKASLESYFKVQIHMPSRLDVSAQGLVVVSLHPDAHARLQQAFESRSVHKTYYFATAADVPWKALCVDLPIARDPRHAVLRTVSGADSQHALTHLTRCGPSRSGEAAATLVRAEPVTGRTHQIRVHAASQSAPIIGDNFYGGAPASSLHLLSQSLALNHPLTGRRLEISLPASLTPAWFTLPSKH